MYVFKLYIFKPLQIELYLCKLNLNLKWKIFMASIPKCLPVLTKAPKHEKFKIT